MANRYYQGPVSDHFDGKRFFQPGVPSTDKTLIDVLRWRLLGKRAPWPAAVPARSGLRPEPRVQGLRITSIGHASLLIQVAGTNLLLDPVWAERASPLRRIGPIRHNPPAVALADLPPVDGVLVTHNHYDHMDLGTIRRVWDAHAAPIFTPLGNDPILRTAVPQAQVQAADWWDSFALPGGSGRATIVPSYHWSSRRLADRRMALWGGFVLETPAGAIYCAGDTAYGDGAIFREIRERFGPPLVAVLPIGAYAPRWFMERQHADPEEALQIALDCGARHALGIHWGTFPLTDEPWNEPPERLETAARSRLGGSATFLAFRAGDTWEPPT